MLEIRLAPSFAEEEDTPATNRDLCIVESELDDFVKLPGLMNIIFEQALDRFPEDVARVNQKITMIHGDPRSDNILYGADGKVVLLDWSLAGHAHPGYDVAYLLSSCLGTDRIGARHELLERYEGALARNGVEIDGADLRATVAAAYRGLAVQQLMSIVVLNNESYGDDSMYDLWMPRILVGIAAEW